MCDSGCVRAYCCGVFCFGVRYIAVWGGYDQQAPLSYRSLWQNIVSFLKSPLQKRPIVLRSQRIVATPLIVATPCVLWYMYCIYMLCCMCCGIYNVVYMLWYVCCGRQRGGGLGSRPKKMYGERLGDGVEYHLMSPTPRR